MPSAVCVHRNRGSFTQLSRSSFTTYSIFPAQGSVLTFSLWLQLYSPSALCSHSCTVPPLCVHTVPPLCSHTSTAPPLCVHTAAHSHRSVFTQLHSPTDLCSHSSIALCSHSCTAPPICVHTVLLLCVHTTVQSHCSVFTQPYSPTA